ncbi:RNA polymerase sigma factor sigW AltName: Full=Sigma-W factor [Fibrisoma limi BUZ 3]|uniref:SigX protein n=1 Tax=Fibrisoma limi BUZ 3 TaxID=1185876 RepID=I2GQ69_9BACT|nr:RNA polymerase sigma factor [Fibrisoma limi]CCH56047.1 RNA polymerase sigma factor sigW AltName: Full=Sigma-W factor [Fibrisoma limi BUZ 3]
MKGIADEELVSLYIETQRNAYFEALYERYCDKVYRKCLSFTKDPMRAEDMAHDIFLRLVIKLGSYQRQAKFSTWLYSITYNYCVDQVRSSQHRHEVYMDEGWELVDVSDDEDTTELAEMQVQQLQRAMNQLTPEEQSILMMKYQDDFSIRDIADMHQTTESAIKMRLKRTRDKLRKYYLEGAVFWLLLALKAVLSVKWPFR